MKKSTRDRDFIKKLYYEGGNDALKKFINENLKYPKKAFEKKVEGTVVLKYDINHKGNVTDCKIISPLSAETNAEAIRVVKLLKFVVPKTYKAKLTYHKTIKIHFRMPKVQPKKVVPQQPQQAQQISYQITPAQKTVEPKKEQPKKPSGGGYSYTIRIN